MISLEKIKQDIRINRFRLDEESEKQSSIYFYYANELAELKRKKDKLETKLELKMSEVELEIREDPPDGIKITESVIKSLVTKDGEVQKLKDELNEIKGEIYILNSVVTSLEQKNSQIKVLKDLFLANYFTVSDKRTTETSMEIRKKLNKKFEKEDLEEE